MSTYTPIASLKLVADASSIAFTSIPQGYTDLVLVTEGLAQTGGGGSIGLRFNDDIGGGTTSYSYGYIFGSGSGIGQGRFNNTNSVPTNRHNVADGGTGTAHIMSYSSNDVPKTVISRGGGNNISIAYAGLWRSTAPITAITCFFESGPGFAAGFGATLYGVTAGDKSQKGQGGNIVVSDGTYVYHAFTSSGIFIPDQTITADYLVVAGGGGSGRTGGGGGAGGLRGVTSATLVKDTPYTAVVGAGGAGAVDDGSFGKLGGNSSFNTTTATGGGGGASFGGTATFTLGRAGGSGGGGGTADGETATRTGGAGNLGGYSPVEGFAGGNGVNSRGAGGGGGATAAGGNASTDLGGAGGAGSSAYSSWGSATGTGQLSSSTYYYAGGGGGSSNSSNGSGASGGLGGGGTKGNGTANTGGGGGSQNNLNGFAGGSGIVIVRYAV